jgi:two-component system, cell cycle sensor histidine kinase and response regulator CckA
VNTPSADAQIASLTAALTATRDLASRTATALEQQREFLEKAQEVAHIGSWVAELDGSDRLTWSKEMFRILGEEHVDSPSTRSQAMNRYVHPDDREPLRIARETAIASGQSLEIDHRVVTTSGAVRWVHTRADIVRDADGRPVRMVGTLQDITERRELEEALRQSQKLEAIGRLAGGISHDLNNALTIIIGYAELVASALEQDAGVRQDVEQIRRAAERAESITRQLLAFSRKQWLEPRVFQVGEAVQDVGRMLDRLVGPRIELATVVADNLPPIYGDRGQIEQAIVNLAINACDAMPTGGTITLRACAVEADAAFVRTHQPMTPGTFVEISVADTGHGMTPEVLAHMFEPFFTTKDVGRGTGLGLAMVYGTVKQSGGFIFVDSQPNQGSVFRLFFPPAPPQQHASQLHASMPAPVHGVTVLVVEDEPSVRGLVTAALRREGYQVLQAESGKAAIDAASQAGRIDVLLTDVAMPGMSGIELASTLSRTQADMRVVVMSGHPPDALGLPRLQRPIEFLAKPFTPRELRQRMYAVLADATAPPE